MCEETYEFTEEDMKEFDEIMKETPDLPLEVEIREIGDDDDD